MNTSRKELAELTNFISNNINTLPIQELGRLTKLHTLLCSKVCEEVVSTGPTAPEKATIQKLGDDYLMENQEEVNRLLDNLVENFNHKQKEYNELLFDLVFGLMAAPETSDRDEWYRIRIMLLYKVMMDLGDLLFPNSYINKKSPAKLKAM